MDDQRLADDVMRFKLLVTESQAQLGRETEAERENENDWLSSIPREMQRSKNGPGPLQNLWILGTCLGISQILMWALLLQNIFR